MPEGLPELRLVRDLTSQAAGRTRSRCDPGGHRTMQIQIRPSPDKCPVMLRMAGYACTLRCAIPVSIEIFRARSA